MTNTNVFTGAPSHILKVASPRGVSPTRSCPTTSPGMPSPRSSPAIRPTSPLSPRFENARFESIPPQARGMHRSAGNTSRRANTSSLRLPALPRFHPANFPSAHSSAQLTPESGTNSPQPPSSPRSHQRVISDAQKHLLLYRRETVSMARSSSPAQLEKPLSPRLAPLGSPGPVTPLELENSDGYLMAGAMNGGEQVGLSSGELVDRLIAEEKAQHGRTTSNNAQRPGSR